MKLLKDSQKLNLVCRMAGNIFSKGLSENEAVLHALNIFEKVEKQILDDNKKDYEERHGKTQD